MNLTLGRHLLTDGTLPKIDPYLFTIPDYHWHVWHEWLAYIYYYVLYLVSGLSGIIFVRALMLTGVAAGFWRLFRSQGRLPPVVVSAVILATFIVAFERCRADRASFFGDLIFTGFLAFLMTNDLSGKLKKGLYTLPLVFLFWVNIHPSFPLGWAFFSLYILLNWHKWPQTEQTKWLFTWVTCVAITILNPLYLYGVLYPFKAFFVSDFAQFKDVNSEWVSVFTSPLFSVGMKWRIGAFLTLGIFIVGVGLRRRQWFSFIATLALVYLATSAVRFTSIAAFGIGLLVLSELSTWNWALLNRRALMLLPAYAALIGAILFYPPSLAAWWPAIFFKGGLYLPNIPIGAVRFMASLPPSHVFNDYTSGGLIAWELRNHMKIAGHGHIDSPTLATKYYWRFSQTPEDFRDIIGNGHVDYFLVLKSVLEATPDSGWVQELNNHWLKIYMDDNAIIFKRLHNYKR